MANPRPSWKALVCATTFSLLAALTASDALAAPELPADPVNRFLVDHGLIEAAKASSAHSEPGEPADENSFVRRVRDGASDMVLTAMNFLGVPYRRGGDSDHGFDCSGFTRHIFELSLGLVLPRRADEQASASGLIKVQRDELRPGDLVFFNTLRRTFSHVGIYVGEGKFIHSPRAGGEVRVEDMRIAYWMKRFTGARRADTAAAIATAPTAAASSSAAD